MMHIVNNIILVEKKSFDRYAYNISDGVHTRRGYYIVSVQ